MSDVSVPQLSLETAKESVLGSIEEQVRRMGIDEMFDFSALQKESAYIMELITREIELQRRQNDFVEQKQKLDEAKRNLENEIRGLNIFKRIMVHIFPCFVSEKRKEVNGIQALITEMAKPIVELEKTIKIAKKALEELYNKQPGLQTFRIGCRISAVNTCLGENLAVTEPAGQTFQSPVVLSDKESLGLHQKGFEYSTYMLNTLVQQYKRGMSLKVKALKNNAVQHAGMDVQSANLRRFEGIFKDNKEAYILTVALKKADDAIEDLKAVLNTLREHGGESKDIESTEKRLLYMKLYKVNLQRQLHRETYAINRPPEALGYFGRMYSIDSILRRHLTLVASLEVRMEKNFNSEVEQEVADIQELVNSSRGQFKKSFEFPNWVCDVKSIMKEANPVLTS